MMAAVFEKTFIQDLTGRLIIRYCPEIVFSKDNLSNQINVKLYVGPNEYAGGGTVTATVIRSDGNTVPISGSISGNVASVTLIEPCMDVPGQIQVFIRLTSGNVKTTIFAGVFTASRTETDTIIDPGTIIPSITELINQIDAAIDSIPADYSTLLGSVAGTYSASKTYAVGDYVWYNGQLYRCSTAITTAEAWTAAHWTSAVISDDVTGLKSALDEVQGYFVLPDNYDRLTDKTVLSNKAFDQTGNIIDGGSLLFPMYIPVEPNTTYVGSGFNYYGSVRGYNSNYDFVQNGVTVDVKKITTGAETRYIRFCVNNNAVPSNVIFQKGDTPTTIPYLAELSDDVGLNPDTLLPFKTEGLSESNKNAVRAIKAFEIHCADPSAKVVLTRILKANGNVYAVVITVNGTTYNVLNALVSAYTETSYNEFNLSNIVYGYFVIDWSQLTSGVAYNGINATLKQTYVYPYVETQKYKNVEILLPARINVAVGHEISLEYYNIIYCSDINEYEVSATPNNASFQNLGSRLRINPASAGDTTITVSVYKNSVLIATKQTVVHAVADSQPSIKAIFLGDSMTAQGFFLAELKRMLGANITLYGTRTSTAEDSTGETQTIANEGRAGWSTSDYVNQASKNGIINPFYNNGFDFAYYMSNNPSFTDVTDVFVLLGTNDGAGTTVMENYNAICDSIKAYNSNIRLHCMLPIPNINSGYAWGTRNYSNWLNFKNIMFNTAKKINTEYDSKTGCYVVPINANLNCYYDFPQTEVAVNNRNPQLIAVGNENVHPSKYGYYRFSDVIYGDIIANCN